MAGSWQCYLMLRPCSRRSSFGTSWFTSFSFVEVPTLTPLKVITHTLPLRATFYALPPCPPSVVYFWHQFPLSTGRTLTHLHTLVTFPGRSAQGHTNKPNSGHPWWSTELRIFVDKETRHGRKSFLTILGIDEEVTNNPRAFRIRAPNGAFIRHCLWKPPTDITRKRQPRSF